MLVQSETLSTHAFRMYMLSRGTQEKQAINAEANGFPRPVGGAVLTLDLTETGNARIHFGK